VKSRSRGRGSPGMTGSTPFAFDHNPIWETNVFRQSWP
jgi:hypothetical protein